MKVFDPGLLHDVARAAISACKATEQSGTLVVCDHQITLDSVQSVTLEQTPSYNTYNLIIALDVLDDAEDPAAVLQRLAGMLTYDGQLLIIQPNRILFRGMIAPEAGGTRRSLSFYPFRSLLHSLHPEARFALVSLQDELVVEPLQNGHASDGCPPADAVSFLAVVGSAGNFLPVSSPVTDLNRVRADLQVVSRSIASGAVRSIAFVIDVQDWAYANIVNHIESGLSGRYAITRFFLADYEDKSELISDLFIRNEFDNVHVMWREFLFNTLTNRSAMLKLMDSHQISPRDLADRIARPVITTTIYDHLFLEPEEVAQRQGALAVIDGYSTASGILDDIYRRKFNVPPVVETPDGVNTQFFWAREHCDTAPDQPFRVGWVGNSDWGTQQHSMGADPKGLHSILTPAIEILQQEGRNAVLELADRNIRHRDRFEMRDYYAGEIDVLVCSSRFEGTPNPVLEAMASGCPVISTDVGIVREVCGPHQAEFILPERSVSAMVDALRRMMDDANLQRKLARENRSRSEQFDWNRRIDCWTTLFAHAEKHHAQSGRLVRAELFLARLESYQLSSRKAASDTAATVEKLRQRLATLTQNVAKVNDRNTKLAQANTALRDAIAADRAGGDADADQTALNRVHLMAENQRLESLVMELDDQLQTISVKNSHKRIAELEAHLTETEAWNDQLKTRLAEVEAWSQELQQSLQHPRSVTAVFRRVFAGRRRTGGRGE